jgi:glycosyltransferase involved in cell wall biosynthesis
MAGSRNLPNLGFVVCGFSKCGTTTLCALLDAHPQIFMSRIKEPWFFSSKYDPEDWSAYEGVFSGAPSGAVLGEGSTNYSSIVDEVQARRRILRHFRDIKLLFIARDPIARIESSFREFHHSGWKYIQNVPYDLEAALDAIPQLTADTCYWTRLSNYRDHVREDQILVVFLEDLIEDRSAVLRRCFQFLGVNPGARIPKTDVRLNIADEKLFQTTRMRALVRALREEQPRRRLLQPTSRNQDVLLQALGLRRPIPEGAVVWTKRGLDRAMSEFEDDVSHFLRHCGKPDGFWPRFADARRGAMPVVDEGDPRRRVFAAAAEAAAADDLRPVILVYAEFSSDTVLSNLGISEYSYTFVMERFVPVLERLGLVVRVEAPEREAGPFARLCQSVGRPCLFLSFAPPHKTPVCEGCQTIPVFAWEFEDIPNEAWSGERHQDWRSTLARCGAAITHSRHAAAVVRKAMGDGYPVAAIPAPLQVGAEGLPGPPLSTAFEMRVCGTVDEGGSVTGGEGLGESVKSEAQFEIDFDGVFSEPSWARDVIEQTLSFAGIVYTAVLSAGDSRKNWRDIVAAFGVALRERTDATLVVKLVGQPSERDRHRMRSLLRRLHPMRCRIAFVAAHLDIEQYTKLALHSAYAVNASAGEGQCLPLMEFMALGTPAVAPRHTGMADYLDEDNAFLVRSSLEPAAWPHDPRGMIRTFRHRIDMESLMEAYRESYRVAKEAPETYRAMSANARRSLSAHANVDLVEAKLRDFLTDYLTRD